MPARRKAAEPQTPQTTPQKTRTKRNDSGGSLSSSLSSSSSQRYTAYLKERPSPSSSYSSEDNPFSKEDEIFGRIKLANSQPTTSSSILDDDYEDDSIKNQFVPSQITTDRGIVIQNDHDNDRPGLLKRGLNFWIGSLAKLLNLIGFTIFLLFWCIKKSIDFVWNNLNGPFSNSITSTNNNNTSSVPITTTTTTTTISNNKGNKRNKWLIYLLLFTIIILLLLLLNGDDNKRRLVDYFPSHYKLQIWPLSGTTYKIQPIEKVDDDVTTGNDKNDSITFTVEDFRNMIIAEVQHHLKSEDQKRLPSSPAEQNEMRNIINDEIKNIFKKFNIRPDSRLHRSSRGEEMLEIIRKEASQVVKAELLKYSQDKLNKPDFALHSGGAKVISKFTSKTYELWPDKWYQRTFAYLSGQGILRGKPPVTAIKHDTNVGECWPFPGQEGQLAVLLNRRVYVTAVTYDHVSKDIAVDIYSAPKVFEVWGIVDDGTGGKANKDDDEDLDLDRTYDMESTEELCGPREDGEYVPGKNNNLPNGDNNGDNNNNGGSSNSGGLSHWNPPLENLTKGELHLGSSPLHLFLGKFTYDIDGLPVQTFEIPQHILKHNKPIRAIIMRINSNWGKQDYTCLYRFRVHGEPADRADN